MTAKPKTAYVIEVDAGYAAPKRIALSRKSAKLAAIDLCADIIPGFTVKKSAWAEGGQKLKDKDGEESARLYIYGLPLFQGPQAPKTPTPEPEPEPFTYMDDLQGATRYSAECVRNQSHWNDGDDVCTRCGAHLNG